MDFLNRSTLCCVVLICSVTQMTANAQQPEKYFGLGLDSFYEADYERVIAHLDTAESLGMNDARMYLYRGIAKIRAGQADSGKADLQTAAKFEARFGTRYVGRLIERLNGSERKALTDYRDQARFALAASNNGDEPEASNEGSSFPPDPADSVAEVDSLDLADDSTDPFLDDSLGLGEFVAASINAESDPFAAGDSSTDAVASDDTGMENPFDSFDVPADGESDGGIGDQEFGDGPPQSEPKKKSIFGSIVNAIGKSAVPTKAIEQVRNQIPNVPVGPAPPPAADNPPPGFTDEGNSDGFEDEDFDIETDNAESDGDFGGFDDDAPDEGNPFENDDF